MQDLRALLIATAAWLGALLVLLLPGRSCLAVVLCLSAVTVLAVRRRWIALAWLAPLVALVGVAGIGALHQLQVTSSPVSDLAEERAVVGVELLVTSDARTVAGRFGTQQVLRARVVEVAGRGSAWQLSTPVVILASADWVAPPLGARIRTTARLAPADGEVAAMVMPRGDPVHTAEPDSWWDAAAAIRASIRASVADRGLDERELVPALVVGDDQGLAPGLAADFRATGLTHLLAVSGTNLTLVVGFLLIVGRWVGLRGRSLWAVAVIGIVGFVLVARTEPSVVRAAAMGSVALIAMGSNGRQRGARSLGVAVLVLLLLQPHLAITAGFVLSVLATGGILLLGPPWRDALQCWMPRWCAEALAVPLAAQIACTPVVAAISGQVSLVAVFANLLVAPAVAPATVLGLAGGLLGLIWTQLGVWVAAPAAWSVGWIIFVARVGADLPAAAVDWGSGPVAVSALTAMCFVAVIAAPRVLGQRRSALACTGILVAAITMPAVTLGWPPSGWVLAMCDVGQGDAFVLRAGPGTAIVVDSGPDPEMMDACLDRLEVTSVPMVLLTHFHADHVDGLAGVLAGRQVGTVVSTSLADPETGVAAVQETLGDRPLVLPHAVAQRIGEVTFQPIWPPADGAPAHSGEGSAANDASVVLMVQIRGVRILLTGDIEPPAQSRLARQVSGLGVDVLKVPHHGSRHQDLSWLTSLGAGLALVSVGADNDYGHPAPETVAALEATGAKVWRSDVSGDVAVVERDGEVGVVARG